MGTSEGTSVETSEGTSVGTSEGTSGENREMNIELLDKDIINARTKTTSVFINKTSIDNIRIGDNNKLFEITISDQMGNLQSFKGNNVFMKEIKNALPSD